MLEEAPAPAVTTAPMSAFADRIYRQKYAHPGEDWPDTALRVVTNVLGELGYSSGDYEFDRLVELVSERKFVPGGRYLYASGRGLHQTQNCMLYRAEDSREGWAELGYKTRMALMTGAGVGVVYSDIRPKGTPISKTGGFASGPLSLAEMTNEDGRRVMQGGSRRSAIWAGLSIWHPDCEAWIRCKDWPQWLREAKEHDFNHPAPMELTNVSVLLDDEFFAAMADPNYVGTKTFTWGTVETTHAWARKMYKLVVKQMVRKAEPGFSVDVGENAGEDLRNACTEVTSRDDSDVCNLGSLNMAAFKSKSEFSEAVNLATLFLLAGTVYSHLPHESVVVTRERNRRLGLGVMGVHEWLLQRGKQYGPDATLGGWLDEYARSGDFADSWADQHDLSRPLKTRAIAPTGTIGIIAETTTGIEPIFSVAFKRRYLKGEHWKYEWVVDPTAHRLVTDHGVDPRDIEDAYMLSYEVERRVAFQAWVQKWVDHGISSTINLPAPIHRLKEIEAFEDMLLPYLPHLRGITCYPDGARGGQPLTPTSYEHAMEHSGVVFEESEEKCVAGACGL